MKKQLADSKKMIHGYKYNRAKMNRTSYRSNEEWITALKNTPDEGAAQELQDILIRGLKPALAKYIDKDLDQFVEDVAQDGLLKIIDNLHTFRGERKFTTWAMKLVVRESLTELRHKQYDDTSIDDLKSENDDTEVFPMTIANVQSGPDRVAHESQFMETLKKIMDQELTEKQKTTITALIVQGLPLSVVAEQMGTNRNALYKQMHEARLKIKNKLEVEGINPDDILNELK